MKNKLPIDLINGYQQYKKEHVNNRCVHYPTCSAYSKELYRKYDIFSSTFKTIYRIITCTPLNKKTIDLPLKNKEIKELKEKSKGVIPYLTELSFKYPCMEIDDYIKFLYQRNFGPSHFNIKKDDCLKRIKEESFQSTNKECVEPIGNGFVRYNFNKDTDIELLVDNFINSQDNLQNEETEKIFLYEVQMLLELIDKNKIPLNYQISRFYILNYLCNGIKPLHHSKRYNEIYHPHYLLIKQEYLK